MLNPLGTAAVSPAAADPNVPALPWPMPNWKPPVVSRLSRLTPMFLASVRLISAIRTLSVTWSGTAVFSRLIGRMSSESPSFLPGLSSEVTMDWACAASSGEATVPLITATWPMVVTSMLASGIAARSTSFTELRFWLTRTLVA